MDDKSMNYLGVDPGMGGGIVLLDGDGNVLRCSKMPLTCAELLLEFNACAPDPTQVRAVLERVSSSPKMGVVSSFTFGRGYGTLEMGLTSVGIRFDEVVPIKWQNALSCRTGGDKNVSKRRAQQLFPDVKVTHANADALLIAEYARRLFGGILAAQQ